MKLVAIGLVFNALDIISGIVKAWKNHEIVSSKLRDGIFKKSGFIMLYALGYLVDNYGLYIGFSFDFSLLKFIMLTVVITEIVSILENLDDLTGEHTIITDVLNKLHISKGGETD